MECHPLEGEFHFINSKSWALRGWSRGDNVGLWICSCRTDWAVLQSSVCCLSYDTIHTEWRMSPSKSSVKYKEMASSGSTLSWGQEPVNLNPTREE